METLQLVTSLLSEWLLLIPARPLIQVLAISVGIFLIFRLNGALHTIERAVATPRTLQADVIALHKQIEDLGARVAETRRQQSKPPDPTDVFAVYRNL